MNSLRRRAALIIVTGAVIFVSLPTAFARENSSFGLTPHPERKDGRDRTTFSIPLEPGATFEDAVRIYNRTDQTLNLIVYAADAEAELDDKITVGFKTSRPKGIGSWVDLAREDVALSPRSEIVVTFRVRVENAEPKPDLGAIVVENTDTGLGSKAAQRLHIVARTLPPNTSTTSVRVRPLLLRSPWIVLALIGLLVAGALVWLAARRAKRPKDTVVPVGELGPDATQDASRPVLKRLGEAGKRTSVPERSRKTRGRDERPLIDDALLVEDEPLDDDDDIDLDEASEPFLDESDEEAVRPSTPRTRKPPPRAKRASAQVTKRKPSASKAKSKAKPQQNFIPLKDL